VRELQAHREEKVDFVVGVRKETCNIMLRGWILVASLDCFPLGEF